MPTTTSTPPPARPLPRAEAGAAGRLLLLAAALAAAELVLGLLVGRFFAWERAEAGLFLAFRPWAVLAAALAAAARPTRERAALYGGFLLLAAAAETLLVLALGATAPWAEALRGLGAGAALALVADLAVRTGRRLGGRTGGWGGAAILGLLLALPATRAPWDALTEGRPAAEPSGPRPQVLLMTGLPLVWGEGGPFDPGSRPATAYAELASEFDFRPVDVLDPESLGAGRLLLLAQPQRLSPEELVALDAWVRAGGRALIFADPLLVWPSELPLGDIRRPPPTHLLSPLLDHWGVAIDPPPSPRRETEAAGRRRLTLEGAGRIRGPGCTGGAVARCAVGRGRAILVADADLLRDELWAPFGAQRARRTADNPLAVADWLDELAGIRRARRGGDVVWMSAGSPAAAAGAAALPLAAAMALGLALGRRRR